MYSKAFETGVTKQGARYVAYWDGEFCGEHLSDLSAREAIAARDWMERAVVELDRVARPFFCDGRYGVWRAVEYGECLSSEVEHAFENHYRASMAFNRAIGRLAGNEHITGPDMEGDA